MRLTPRVAGFRLEYPAGFELECMAGFVGTRSCFRMFNQHIIELYEKVQIGANVYVEP